MSDMIRTLSESEFTDAVIKADKPVLVDFWAEWCGPCHAIAPILEVLADEFADTIEVVKVNVDQSQSIASAMGIRNIPTLVVFRNGQAVAQHRGAAGLVQLREFLAEAL